MAHKIKVGIIGTRGIPNQYGGFEQFAEKVSPRLVQMGYDITVYNSSLHPYQEAEWEGVHIVSCKDPENKIGTAGQFLYDLNCIRHARRSGYDIVLQLGYTSSSVWNFLIPHKQYLITNMDGLEWKRSKYNKPTQRFLRYAEKLAIRHSDVLISDSKGIQKYLRATYDADSSYIAYGADLIKTTDVRIVSDYRLEPGNYNLAIARFEPENNLEMIIQGHVSQSEQPLMLIGNHKNKFGQYLQQSYSAYPNIRFLGPIYDPATVNALRQHARLYFHGHSVGGTNPSLLEAMGCGCLIAAHDNEFNRGVLSGQAFYFKSKEDIQQLLAQNVQKADYQNFIEQNYAKIETEFNWEHITHLLDTLFQQTIATQHA